MASKAKEEFDLYGLNDKSNKKKNVKKSNKRNSKAKTNNNTQRNTKEEKFDFNDEIVIGLKKRDVPIKQNAKANKRSKPKKKLTKQQELAFRKRRVIFRIIKWTSCIAIVIGGIIYTLLSPIFNIKNINVVGNSKISVDEIISLSTVETENNMFKYNAKKIKQNIKQNAYIENVQLIRKLPDTIEFVVEEREATYIIQIGNAYAYIDNQGYILEISDKKLDLPLLEEIQTIQEDIQVANRLCDNDLIKLNDILKIMESANSNEISNLITKINIKDSNNYILTMQSKNKIIYLGDISNLSTKMLWIIRFNEEEGKTKGEIFLNMNLNNKNSKPYFRKQI